MGIGRSANQENERAACGPRAEVCSEDSASGDDGAEKFGLEIFRGEVGYGHGPPAEETEHVFFAELADGASGLEHAPEIAATGIIEVGRSGGECVGDDFADLTERLLEFGILGGVFLREGGDFLRGFCGVLIER